MMYLLFHFRPSKKLFCILVHVCTGVFFFSGCKLKRTLIEDSAAPVLDEVPFAKAGGEIGATLTQVHGSSFQSAPAAVRPDPDLFARRLLKLFRPDGNTFARQLGQVEEYRLMLGGASDDFRTVPQSGYDSTSLLTLQKVARLICVSIVAPNSSQHPGWVSVLPNPPSEVGPNVKFLMSRMLGLNESALNISSVSELTELVNAFAEDGVVIDLSYVNACTAIALDGEALLL
ncbi:MAG: hypothetical protein RJB13_858 [Pseudomonadota bacterium]